MKFYNYFYFKIKNIWHYHRIPTIIGFICLFLLVSIASGSFSKKEKRLGVAYINIATDQSFITKENSTYINALELNPKKENVEIFTNLYLTENTSSPFFKDAYISSLKIMAAVETQTIDMAILDEEALKILTESGYLIDLNDFITDSNLLENKYLEAHLVSMDIDGNQGSIATGIDISEIMNSKGFNPSNRVYLGIIANTKHSKEALNYLIYVSTDHSGES